MSTARVSGSIAQAVPSAVILAGGQSKRFGDDKVWAKIHGQPMIERIVQLLRTLDFQVVISTDAEKNLSTLGCPLVFDQVTHQGPLAALHHVLQHTALEKLMLLSCDMPFLTSELVSLLWERSDDRQATVLMSTNEQVLPLPGVYSRSLFPLIEQKLASNRRALKSVLDTATAVHRIPWTQWKACDPHSNALSNINTPQDLANAYA